MHLPGMIVSLHEMVVIIFQFRQQSRLQIKTHIMYHGGVALDGEGDIKYAAVGNPLPNTNTFSIPSMMLRVCVLWNLKAVIMPSFWALFLGSNVHVRRPLATHSTSLLFTGDEKISSTLYLHCATYTAQRRCACLPRRWEIVPSAFTSKACPRKTCPLEAHF